MYNPTTRLLTILELLQAHPTLSGDALARRLEVEPRSVRRYITMLQDMGMPIEAVRGPGGGYQLRPGFKLPPLLFTEEEATAIVLGLLSTSWLALGQSPVAVEGALAKVLRVLPVRARERMHAVSSHLVVSQSEREGYPDASVVIDLSEAIQLRRRVALAYRSPEDVLTQRTVEPYGLAGWWGHWYLAAYCCLRKGFRLFRLDRVQEMHVLDEAFKRAEGFDVEGYVRDSLAGDMTRWQIKVQFYAPLHRIKEKIPKGYGVLSETPEGVLFETRHSNLADVAMFLTSRRLPFVALEPPELRDELLLLAERVRQSAGVAYELPQEPANG
jgi:predicted DNA-binding transcriptional regulator YafY